MTLLICHQFLLTVVLGQERFQGLGTSFYRGADGVAFVFDITRRVSATELRQE